MEISIRGMEQQPTGGSPGRYLRSVEEGASEWGPLRPVTPLFSMSRHSPSGCILCQTAFHLLSLVLYYFPNPKYFLGYSWKQAPYSVYFTTFREVRSAQCMAHGARHTVHSAQHKARGARREALGARHKTHSTKHRAQSAEHKMHGTQ